MKKIFVILMLLTANFAFSMNRGRPHTDKDKYLAEYQPKKDEVIRKHEQAIRKAQENGEPTLALLLGQSLSITSSNLRQFEQSLGLCDRSLWLDHKGKRYDCNELIDMYKSILNFEPNQ